MPEVTCYHKPFPPVEDRAAGSGREGCPADTGGWNCSRIAGHDGDHQAGGTGGQMYASWPAEEVTP